MRFLNTCFDKKETINGKEKVKIKPNKLKERHVGK
jgi:hypothetical protein